MPAQSDFNEQAKTETTGEIPHGAVAAELEHVVASSAFGKAERPARFLRHLVQKALLGEGHVLKESVLGMDVFERPATWDPRLDPIVRQEAARLRKRLAKYYENGGASAEIRIDLPVGSYVPVFRRAHVEAPHVEAPHVDAPHVEALHVDAPHVEAPAEVPAETLVEASFAPPVEAVPAPAPVPAPSPVSVRRTRIPLYVAAAVVCIAGAIFASRAFAPREVQPSIAILPFTNLTSDLANQYFSDGLTDEITDLLARFKTLRVIARTSTFQFKGKTPDIREVGRLLNVTNVLEGSVERSGDRVKVIAHLERVADAALIWSNTYERNASDIFALQSELAAGIAESLKVATGAPSAKHVPVAEAHESALRARYDIQQMTTESLSQAEAEYRHAVDLDPKYAAGYLGLAIAKFDRFVARGSNFQTEAERRSVEEELRKALDLDPDLSSAHAMLAAFAMQYDWNWGLAERELQSAMSGSSSSSAESYYAFLLISRGRFAEADQHIQRMMDLDPYSTATLNNLAVARNLEGRFAEARETAQRLASQYPKMIPPQQMIGGTYVEQGHPELAMPIFQQLEPRFPQARVFEAMAWAASGDRAKALALIRPFEEKYPNTGVSMQWFALVYALMGDQPNTVKWLQRSADLHEWQAVSIAVQPVFAPMRNTPEFRALERRMGLR